MTRIHPSPLPTLRNRALLGVTGAALLGGGGWLLTAWTPVAQRLSAAPTGRVFADRALFERLQAQAWWTPAVIAAACAVIAVAVAALLLGLRRLLARGGTVPLASDSRVLRVGALSDTLAERVRAVDGVAGCRAVVRRRRKALDVELRVRLRSSPAPLLDALPALADEAGRSAAPLTVRLHARLDGPARPRRTRSVR